MPSNLIDQFNYGRISESIKQLILSERAFNDVNAPRLSEIYKDSFSPYEYEVCLTRSLNNNSASLDEFRARKSTIFTASHYPKDDAFFRGKIDLGLRVVSLIEEIYGPEKQFNSHLEIAAGTALSSYAMRYVGLVTESDANDIVDRGHDCSNPYELITSYILNHSRQIDYRASGDERDTVNSYIFGYSRCTEIGSPIFSKKLFDSMNDSSSGKENIEPFDNYYADDFISADFKKSYDLVTMIFGINYFKSQEFFGKASSLMKSGGVLVCINDSFFEVCGGGMHLPVIMPWIHTLFDKNQLISHFSNYFSSEIAEYLELSYYYPESHVSARTQRETAIANGFKLVSQRRIRNPEAPTAIISANYNRFATVFKAINDFKADSMVCTPDLSNYFLVQVFEKC